MLRTFLLTAILALGWRTAAAAASPVVLSLSYSCPDVNIHIGSTITFDMAVGMVSTSADQAPVSNTVATTDLWLSDVNIQNDALFPTATNLLVTDGTRTWSVASKVNTGATSYIDIKDSEVVEGPVVGDYSQLSKNTFTVYVGTLATSVADPGSIVWLRLGNLTFPDITQFSDTGHLGDWRQTWTVTDIGGQYSDVAMSPYATIGGLAASLPNPLPGSWDIAQMIDALLPKINLLKVSSISGLSSFAGMMYIGHSTQGLAVDAKHANDTSVITVDSNKPNCQVRLSVINTAPAYVDPQGYIPIVSQLAPYEGALTWSGVTGAGKFVPDGQYTVQVDIQDANGVQGTSATALIYVTSLQLSVQNLALMPSQVISNLTSTLLTNISYQVYLSNDDGTNLMPGLQNLNWGAPLTTASLNDYDYRHNVFAIMDVHVLDNAGNEMPGFSQALSGPDFGANVDSDSAFLARVWKNIPSANSPLPLGACTDPTAYLLAAWNAIVTGTIGSDIVMGDGNKGNDWDSAFTDNGNVSCRLKPISTDGGGNPTQLYGNWSVAWQTNAGSMPPVGLYQIYGKATLTGMEIFWGGLPPSPNVVGCDGAADYLGDPGHCYPSSRPEVGYGSSYRGCGLNASSTIQGFTVANGGSTVQDTTPPLLISTNPSNGSTVNPGVFGGPSGQTITASLTDASAIDPSSVISVTRSLGGLVQTITGVATGNAGGVVNGVNTYQLFFYPAQVLTAGGTYTITIVATDSKKNTTTYTSTFVLTDQGVPTLGNVFVLDRVGTSFTVYPGSLSTPLDSGAQIVAKLSMDTSITQNFITGATLGLKRTDVSPAVDESGFLGTPVVVTNTASTNLTLTVPISPLLTVGTYQITVNATAQNPGTNNVYSTSFGANPVIQFSVVQPVSDINIYLGNQIVLAMVQPITVTSSTFPGPGGFNPTLFVAQSYNMSAINLPSGYVQLSGTAALNFYVNQAPNIGVNGHNLNFSFNTVSPTVMTLYFNPSQVPSSITPTTLCILGWDLDSNKLDIDGPSQNTMSNFIASANWDYINGTVNITFLPGKTVTDEIFFVGYNVATNTSGSPTAVPTPSRSTRSFNPNSSDPLHNKATIYVAAYAAFSGIVYPTVDVKIYSMAGVLVRKFSATTFFDTVANTDGYCYTWNGKNDAGSLVNNGIYLAVTQVHLAGGTSTLRNILAVIK